MKIVDLQTFLQCRPGTLYQKYTPDIFGPLAVFEGRCGETDFISDDTIECGVPSELIDLMVDSDESWEVEFGRTGRDGMFAKDQLFAVWEEGDVVGLMEVAVRALDATSGGEVAS